MIEIKIRFKSGDVGYFKLLEENVVEIFDFLKDVPEDGLNGILELIDLADDKKTLINISEISTFGYSKVE